MSTSAAGRQPGAPARPPVQALTSACRPLPLAREGAAPPMPLGLLGAGERAEVVSAGARHEGAGSCRHEEMGLRPGRLVEMLAGGGGGPLLVKVDESRLALGRGMAMRILVRRLP